MFRCKLCKVRLYEKDCAGHLGRHGLTVDSEQVLDHFERGPATASSRPGEQKSVYGQQAARKRAKQASSSTSEDPPPDEFEDN